MKYDEALSSYKAATVELALLQLGIARERLLLLYKELKTFPSPDLLSLSYLKPSRSLRHGGTRYDTIDEHMK